MINSIQPSIDAIIKYVDRANTNPSKRDKLRLVLSKQGGLTAEKVNTISLWDRFCACLFGSGPVHLKQINRFLVDHQGEIQGKSLSEEQKNKLDAFAHKIHAYNQKHSSRRVDNVIAFSFTSRPYRPPPIPLRTPPSHSGSSKPIKPTGPAELTGSPGSTDSSKKTRTDKEIEKDYKELIESNNTAKCVKRLEKQKNGEFHAKRKGVELFPVEDLLENDSIQEEDKNRLLDLYLEMVNDYGSISEKVFSAFTVAIKKKNSKACEKINNSIQKMTIWEQSCDYVTEPMFGIFSWINEENDNNTVESLGLMLLGLVKKLRDTSYEKSIYNTLFEQTPEKANLEFLKELLREAYGAHNGGTSENREFLDDFESLYEQEQLTNEAALLAFRTYAYATKTIPDEKISKLLRLSFEKGSKELALELMMRLTDSNVDGTVVVDQRNLETRVHNPLLYCMTSQKLTPEERGELVQELIKQGADYSLPTSFLDTEGTSVVGIQPLFLVAVGEDSIIAEAFIRAISEKEEKNWTAKLSVNNSVEVVLTILQKEREAEGSLGMEETPPYEGFKKQFIDMLKSSDSNDNKGKIIEKLRKNQGFSYLCQWNTSQDEEENRKLHEKIKEQIETVIKELNE